MFLFSTSFILFYKVKYLLPKHPQPKSTSLVELDELTQKINTVMFIFMAPGGDTSRFLTMLFLTQLPTLNAILHNSHMSVPKATTTKNPLLNHRLEQRFITSKKRRLRQKI